MSTSLRLPNGRIIRLDTKVLGKGAEGVIHGLADTPDLCAKIYFDVSSDIEDRLEALKRHPAAELRGDHNEHLHLAWPKERLIDDTGTTRGFLMPRVEGEPLSRLFDPTTRLVALAEPSWRTALAVAARTARLLDMLHEKGLVIGDVSPANIMVARSGHITLIDCDTVQFTDSRTGLHYPCRKLTPRYCPPEINTNSSLTAGHDSFCLAILVCELLMEGDHPFDGVPSGHRVTESSVAENIKLQNNRVVFPERLVAISDAMPATVLPPSVMALAAKCFGEGHRDPAARPTAKVWAEALDLAGFELMGCRHNERHSFHHSQPICVWCKLRDEGHGERYPAAAGVGRPTYGAPSPTTPWEVIPPPQPQPVPVARTQRPQQPTPAIPTTPKTPTTGSTTPDWVPWAVVAAVILLIIILASR